MIKLSLFLSLSLALLKLVKTILIFIKWTRFQKFNFAFSFHKSCFCHLGRREGGGRGRALENSLPTNQFWIPTLIWILMIAKLIRQLWRKSYTQWQKSIKCLTSFHCQALESTLEKAPEFVKRRLIGNQWLFFFWAKKGE